MPITWKPLPPNQQFGEINKAPILEYLGTDKYKMRTLLESSDKAEEEALWDFIQLKHDTIYQNCKVQNGVCLPREEPFIPMTPIEIFQKPSPLLRRQLFFKSLDRGHILYLRVENESYDSYKLLALAKYPGCSKIDDLSIVMYLPKYEQEMKLLDSPIGIGSLIKAALCSCSIRERRLNVTLDNSIVPTKFKALKLGKASETELPHYIGNAFLGISYTDYVFKTQEFRSRKWVEQLPFLNLKKKGLYSHFSTWNKKVYPQSKYLYSVKKKFQIKIACAQHSNSGNLRQAFMDTEVALRLDPTFIAARKQMSSLLVDGAKHHVEQGNEMKAKESLAMARDLDTSNQQAYLSLEEFKAQMDSHLNPEIQIINTLEHQDSLHTTLSSEECFAIQQAYQHPIAIPATYLNYKKKSKKHHRKKSRRHRHKRSRPKSPNNPIFFPGRKSPIPLPPAFPWDSSHPPSTAVPPFLSLSEKETPPSFSTIERRLVSPINAPLPQKKFSNKSLPSSHQKPPPLHSVILRKSPPIASQIKSLPNFHDQVLFHSAKNSSTQDVSKLPQLGTNQDRLLQKDLHKSVPEDSGKSRSYQDFCESLQISISGSHGGVSPSQYHVSRSSPQDHKSRSPPQVRHKSKSPPKNLHISRSPPRNLHKSKSPPRRFRKSKSPPRNFRRSRSPIRHIHGSRSIRTSRAHRNFHKSRSPELIQLSPESYGSKSPSPEHQRCRSPPPYHQNSSFINLRSSRSPSPKVRRCRSPSPKVRRCRSRSPSFPTSRTPSPDIRRSMSSSPDLHRNVSPPQLHRSRSIRKRRKSRSPRNYQRSRSPRHHRRSRSPRHHRRSRSPRQHRRSRSPRDYRRSRSPPQYLCRNKSPPPGLLRNKSPLLHASGLPIEVIQTIRKPLRILHKSVSPIQVHHTTGLPIEVSIKSPSQELHEDRSSLEILKRKSYDLLSRSPIHSHSPKPLACLSKKVSNQSFSEKSTVLSFSERSASALHDHFQSTRGFSENVISHGSERQKASERSTHDSFTRNSPLCSQKRQALVKRILESRSQRLPSTCILEKSSSQSVLKKAIRNSISGKSQSQDLFKAPSNESWHLPPPSSYLDQPNSGKVHEKFPDFEARLQRNHEQVKFQSTSNSIKQFVELPNQKFSKKSFNQNQSFPSPGSNLGQLKKQVFEKTHNLKHIVVANKLPKNKLKQLKKRKVPEETLSQNFSKGPSNDWKVKQEKGIENLLSFHHIANSIRQFEGPTCQFFSSDPSKCVTSPNNDLEQVNSKVSQRSPSYNVSKVSSKRNWRAKHQKDINQLMRFQHMANSVRLPASSPGQNSPKLSSDEIQSVTLPSNDTEQPYSRKVIEKSMSQNISKVPSNESHFVSLSSEHVLENSGKVPEKSAVQDFTNKSSNQDSQRNFEKDVEHLLRWARVANSRR